MWVRRTHRQGRITGTKNRLRRQVDMSPHLAATLKDWKLTQKKRSLAQGIPVPEWTFSVRDGKMLHRNTPKWHMDKCLDKIGLRAITLHHLRHSYATIRLMKGHSLVDVSRQLGHQSVKITDKVYGHWIPGSFKKEVHELDGPHLSAPYPHPGRTSIESL